MPFLFYLFSAITLIGGIGVVVFRNPVTSAFSMVVSFLGLAALFIQLNAFLVGILQVLVYAGAIMVLFLFIIMLLDLKAEEKRRIPVIPVAAGLSVFAGFIAVMAWVLKTSGIGNEALPQLQAVSDGGSDVHLIGKLLFQHYWFPIEIVGVFRSHGPEHSVREPGAFLDSAVAAVNVGCEFLSNKCGRSFVYGRYSFFTSNFFDL